MCLHRQLDTLSGRVDELPSPEDWGLMEQALSAILDEAAAQAQREDRLAEEAAQREGGPLGFLEEEEEQEEDAEQASSGESRGAALGLQLGVFLSMNGSCQKATHLQQA